MTRNLGLCLVSIPNGKVQPSDLQVRDRPIDIEATTPPPGGLLVRNHYASFDPYQRGRMRDPSIDWYTPAYPVGEPIVNGSIASVLKSDNPAYEPGNLVYTDIMGPTEEYSILPKQILDQLSRKLQNPFGFDLPLFTGVLGLAGLAGYSSFYEYVKPKAGETIYVSSASGTVGSMVCQLAKREEMKVIGSVGSDAKLKYILEELGVDAGFNYKKEKVADALKRLAPDGIDVDYENVGGENLAASLEALKHGGRVVLSGCISQYNLEPQDKYPITNLERILEKELSITGFLVNNPKLLAYAEEHQRNVQQWIKEGSFKAKLHITKGIENAPQGLCEIFNGVNDGKAVLEIARHGTS